MGIQDKTARVIIGNTAKRPVWIGQKGDGTLPTFEGPIPLGVIERDLFNFQAISVPTGNFIPCEPDSIGSVMIEGKYYLPQVTPGKQGIVRSDDFSELGRHGSGWRAHDYNAWGHRTLSSVVQGPLGVNLALLLKNGAQAAIEVCLDEMLHDGTSGMDFWPVLLFYTSLDGSLSSSYTAATKLAPCDNVFRGVLKRGAAAGRQIKYKHTKSSVNADVVGGVRQAMGIMEREADGLVDFLKLTTAIPTTRKQWLDVLDIIEPPAKEGATKVATTKADNRRQQIDAVYQNDPMASPWAGTVFGGIQAFNTFEHHHRNVRGTSRIERVYDRAIREDFAKSDTAVLNAFAKVMDMPELAMA